MNTISDLENTMSAMSVSGGSRAKVSVSVFLYIGMYKIFKMCTGANLRKVFLENVYMGKSEKNVHGGGSEKSYLVFC